MWFHVDCLRALDAGEVQVTVQPQFGMAPHEMHPSLVEIARWPIQRGLSHLSYPRSYELLVLQAHEWLDKEMSEEEPTSVVASRKTAGALRALLCTDAWRQEMQVCVAARAPGHIDISDVDAAIGELLVTPRPGYMQCPNCSIAI